MKKKVTTMLIVLLLLSLCSSAATKRLEAWCIGFSNEMATIANGIIAKEFTPKTAIEVKIVPIAWGDGDKIFLSIISNDAPDIITGSVVELGIRGSLLDLRKTFGKEFDDLEAQLFPAITAPLHFEGTRFGVPQNVSVMNAAYRTDILAEMGFGIPNLWTDVYKMLPKVKANKKEMGFFYGSPSYAGLWGAYTLITQHGGNFFKTDGFTSALDSPESIRGFKEYVELFTKHKMPQTSTGIPSFRTGEWIMMIDGYWMYTNLLNGAPEIKGKWEPGLIPGVLRSSGEINHGTFTGSTSLGIPKTSKNYKEAWEFIKWFCSPEIQLIYTEEVIAKIPGFLQVPTARSALYNLKGLPMNIAKIIHTQIDESQAVPYAPTSSVLYRFVDFAIQSCLQQGKDPETEAKNAATEMNKEMSRRKVEYKRFLDQMSKENQTK